MKNSFGLLILTAILSSTANAAKLQESCLDVRSFLCTFSYRLNDGSKFSGSAEMKDYKYLFGGQSCDVYQSKLSLKSNDKETVFITEDDNNANDIQDVRDDNPKGRSGWGGKEFYLPISGELAIMTVAKREQTGKPTRDYRLVFLTKNAEGDLLKEAGKGTMTCKISQ